MAEAIAIRSNFSIQKLRGENKPDETSFEMWAGLNARKSRKKKRINDQEVLMAGAKE